MMTYRRKNRYPNNTKSPGAKQFYDGLADEIRFDCEINPLWVKYRFDIKLPDDDYTKVIFNGDIHNPEFKKLKDFISNFEKNWVIESYTSRDETI